MDEQEQVSWNMSYGLIVEISQLLAEANRNWLNGCFDKAFFSLKGVKMRISQTLSTEERQALKDLEAKKVPSVTLFREMKAKYKGNDILLSDALREYTAIQYENYNEALMDLLETKGFLISKKKDASKMNF